MSDRIPRELVVMADYGAPPIWSKTASGGGGVAISLDRLPLSGPTRHQLSEWAARYDQLLFTDDEWTCEEDKVEWIARGRTLARSVADELGAEYRVSYFEESLLK